MTYAANLWIYFLLLFGIVLVPGMDMMFVLANSLHSGKKMGFAAIFGIMLGGIFHTIIGFTLVIAAANISPLLFQSMLIIGSIYMIYIGISLIKSNIFVEKISDDDAKNYKSAFYQGFITCILNPKAYAFVLAVYPNFLKPQYGSLIFQALIMGILTILTQFAVYGCIALAAGHSRDLLLSRKNLSIWIGKSTGVLFLIAAIYNLWHTIYAIINN